METFEEFIGRVHPDPDSMLMMDTFNLRKGEQVRVGYESKQANKLAEKYAKYYHEVLISEEMERVLNEQGFLRNYEEDNYDSGYLDALEDLKTKTK